jgi:hypothetical protein
MNKQNIPIQRTVFGKNTYPRVVDTVFRELNVNNADNDQFKTVDYFFTLYDDLFYEIPPTGDTKSHEFLIKKSTDFVGIEGRSSDVDALIEEINDLRRQLLEANQTIIDLSATQ